MRGPGLDQRAVDREMLVRQQRLHFLVVQKLGHELLEHIAFLKAFPVLGENTRIPDRIVRRKTDKPTKQQIVSSCSISWRSERIE